MIFRANRNHGAVTGGFDPKQGFLEGVEKIDFVDLRANSLIKMKFFSNKEM